MNHIKKIATLFGLFAALSFGQTVLTTTTLSANISATVNVFGVASATGITAMGTNGNYTTMVYVDHELMGVRSVSGTNITVDRGKGSTAFQGESSQTAHKSAAVVWLGPPAAFYQTDPVVGSQCVRTALVYVPYISVPSGKKYDCLGLTTAGAWVRTDANGPGVLGATLASAAGTNTFGGTILTLSGTNAIVNITVPAGAGPGFTFTVLPSGVCTFTAAGNIALAGSCVVGKALVFVYNGTSWYPSYIA